MPKVKPIYTDRDYLEARFSDIISAIETFKDEAKEAKSLAALAHERITKYENRFFGWVVGIGGAGAAGGMAFADTVKTMLKGISGH